jgi:ubiquinone/menaquinone biosynthesis C-methylase UbiE
MRKLWSLVIGWHLVLLLAGAYVWMWVRDRYSGRGPMPYALAAFSLHNPLRPLIHPVRRTLERSHVQPGATVLELGPGTGYFSIEASRIIGAGGRLLCLDIQRPMLVDLTDRLRQAGVANADLILADATRLPLSDNVVDAAYLVTVIGEVPDRPQALRDLRRVLRQGAVLSFTESLTDPDYQLEDSLRDVCRASGFEPLEHMPGLLGYTMNFTVP